jgi:hypothetical protein
MIPECVAAICHEANRRYCYEIGDGSQKPWEEAPWWQKQSAIAGVVFLMQHPGAPPSAMHEQWMSRKLEEGWTYGDLKDETRKIHPCIMDYELLPEHQRVKDALFRAVALALLSGENHV